MSLPDRLLARLVRHGGGRLINSAIGRYLPEPETQEKAKRNVLGGLAGMVAMRIATRSVPGAIVVTSGLVAKKLYDRRKAKAAAGQKDKSET